MRQATQTVKNSNGTRSSANGNGHNWHFYLRKRAAAPALIERKVEEELKGKKINWASVIGGSQKARTNNYTLWITGNPSSDRYWELRSNLSKVRKLLDPSLLSDITFTLRHEFTSIDEDSKLRTIRKDLILNDSGFIVDAGYSLLIPTTDDLVFLGRMFRSTLEQHPYRAKIIHKFVKMYRNEKKILSQAKEF